MDLLQSDDGEWNAHWGYPSRLSACVYVYSFFFKGGGGEGGREVSLVVSLEEQSPPMTATSRTGPLQTLLLAPQVGTASSSVDERA